MYLAGMLMAEGQGYYFSDVMTLSRDTEAPDFGNAGTEKGVFTPGGINQRAVYIWLKACC